MDKDVFTYSCKDGRIPVLSAALIKPFLKTSFSREFMDDSSAPPVTEMRRLGPSMFH